MPRIAELPSREPDPRDKFIIDGPAGTNAFGLDELFRVMFEQSSTNPAYTHTIYPRFKDLGTSFREDQLAAIRDGSFKDLFIGDYWTINGKKYVIVDVDYLRRVGAIRADGGGPTTAPSITIMPEQAAFKAQYHNSTTNPSLFSNTAHDEINKAAQDGRLASAFPALAHRQKVFAYEYGGDGIYIASRTVSVVGWALPTLGNLIGFFSPHETGHFPFSQQFSLFRLHPGSLATAGSFWTDTEYPDKATGRRYYFDADQLIKQTGITNPHGIRPVLHVG